MLQEMTIEEKVHILTGCSFWESGGVARFGVNPLRMTDGPHGARGASLHGENGALLTPCELALAATFNEDLIEEIGGLLGREARRRECDVLLGPTMNLHRFPISGRHFECFSEDPYLTGRCSVAYIKGVQKHAFACMKHFVCNDQETDRGTSNSVVDERTLREAYLAPFEAAVREASPQAAMCGYNRINGDYCTESNWLLQQVLRDEWGFRGLVMSDWFGNHSTDRSANAGLNVEMPGVEPRHYGGYLLEAVKAGRVSADTLNARCLPVLETLLHPNRYQPAPTQTRDEEERILLRAATEACVLLRNQDKALPLNRAQLKKVAVIGPNAAQTVIQGGGSSRVHPAQSETILDAIKREMQGSGVAVVHEEGCPWEMLPWGKSSLELAGLTTMGASDASGQPLAGIGASFNDIALKVGSFISNKEWFRVAFMPAMRQCGLRVKTPEEMERKAKAELTRSGSTFSAVPTTSFVERDASTFSRSEQGQMSKAEALAKDADATILVVGTHGFWELEGVDQPHMNLVGAQDALIQKIAAVAKGPVIVVLNVGSPKVLPWLDQVDAVLLGHFGGQATGAAVADVLFGKANPAGRLPTSWPKRFEDCTAVVATQKLEEQRLTTGQEIKPGDVPYAEGLRLGYRGDTEEEAEQPAFPFGFGLSYTTFAYGKLEVEQMAPCSAEGGPRATAKITIKNTGEVSGSEVAQLYTVAGVVPRALRGFKRTGLLAAGQDTLVTFELDSRALGANFNVEAKAWRAPEVGVKVAITVSADSSSRLAQAELILK